MSDNKERVYSEEDLCEYTILQKIESLEKQLQAVKSEASTLYETKEAANTIHKLLRSNDAKINNRIEDLTKVTPTDVGIKDNKLGLLHDTTWLTNQDAINLGSNMTYDTVTKTLDAKDNSDVCIIELTQTQMEELVTNKITFVSEQVELIKKSIGVSLTYGGLEIGKGTVSHYLYNNTNYYQIVMMISNVFFAILFNEENALSELDLIKFNFLLKPQFIIGTNYLKLFDPDGDYNSNYVWIDKINGNSILHDNEYQTVNHTFIEDKTISLFGKHSILVPKDSTDKNINLYRHEISIQQGGESYIYLTYISSSNLVVNSITDINTLLGTTTREISCTGIINLQGAYNAIHGIVWEGTYTNPNTQVLVTDLSNGEDYQKMTVVFGTPTIKDVVTTI